MPCQGDRVPALDMGNLVSGWPIAYSYVGYGELLANEREGPGWIPMLDMGNLLHKGLFQDVRRSLSF